MFLFWGKIQNWYDANLSKIRETTKGTPLTVHKMCQIFFSYFSVSLIDLHFCESKMKMQKTRESFICVILSSPFYIFNTKNWLWVVAANRIVMLCPRNSMCEKKKKKKMEAFTQWTCCQFWRIFFSFDILIECCRFICYFVLTQNSTLALQFSTFKQIILRAHFTLVLHLVFEISKLTSIHFTLGTCICFYISNSISVPSRHWNGCKNLANKLLSKKRQTLLTVVKQTSPTFRFFSRLTTQIRNSHQSY